jgi:hypothetical protein
MILVVTLSRSLQRTGKERTEPMTDSQSAHVLSPCRHLQRLGSQQPFAHGIEHRESDDR